MKQNKYDDPQFFAKYSKMQRSVGGLDEAQEWHAFRALLPDLRNKRLLDLGCGFGWHCRYARQQQALSIVGVDLSEKMLESARANGAGLPGEQVCGDDLIRLDSVAAVYRNLQRAEQRALTVQRKCSLSNFSG